MNKTKTTHTPGPWSVGDGYQPQVVGGMGQTLEPGYIGIGNGAAAVSRALISGCVSLGEARSNAHLIATAPEYDRVSRDIADEIDVALAPGSKDTFMTLVNRLSRWRVALRATIAKAEGQ